MKQRRRIPFLYDSGPMIVLMAGRRHGTVRRETARGFMIVVMAGLPGTGKSTFARACAGDGRDRAQQRYSSRGPVSGRVCRVLDRAGRFCAGPDGAYRGIRAGPASRVDDIFRRAHILRGPIRLKRDRSRGKVGTAWRIIECVCPENVARREDRTGAKAPGEKPDNRAVSQDSR